MLAGSHDAPKGARLAARHRRVRRPPRFRLEAAAQSSVRMSTSHASPTSRLACARHDRLPPPPQETPMPPTPITRRRARAILCVLRRMPPEERARVLCRLTAAAVCFRPISVIRREPKAYGADVPLPAASRRRAAVTGGKRTRDERHSRPFYQRTVLATSGGSPYPFIDGRPRVTFEIDGAREGLPAAMAPA